MPADRLPLLDEHTTTVAASKVDTWRALLAVLDGSLGGRGARLFARAVGCAETSGSGPRPLSEGSTIVGFRVVSAQVGRELALEGRHRFAAYALRFTMWAEGPTTTRVKAESRAVFPGLGGRAYRALVVGSGGHVVAVRRLLAAVRRRAEPTATR